MEAGTCNVEGGHPRRRRQHRKLRCEGGTHITVDAKHSGGGGNKNKTRSTTKEGNGALSRSGRRKG